MSEWYYQLNGEPSGPFSIEDLCFLKNRGRLGPDALVRRGRQGDWMSAGAVSELFPKPEEVDPAPLHGLIGPREKDPPATADEPEPAAEQPAPDPPHRGASPPALLPDQQLDKTNNDSQKWILIGSSVAAALALLLLLLLMLFHSERPSGSKGLTGTGMGYRDGGGAGRSGDEGDGSGGAQGADAGGSGTTSEDGESEGEGTGAATGSAGGESDGTETTAEQSSSGGQPDAQPSPSGGDDTPVREEFPELPEFQLQQRRESTPAPTETAGSGGGRKRARRSTDKVGVLAGVKVKGELALVCDVSGSMAQDFPILVRELREKVPKDTPLILVNGCYFEGTQYGQQNLFNLGPHMTPRRLKDVGGAAAYYGINFANDNHVYVGSGTTHAILFAVDTLECDTVMFNNDLQDGGQLMAVKAMEDLWKKKKFILSGRSLNCQAPPVLQSFIEKTGGEFKLDPIGRGMMPARQWN